MAGQNGPIALERVCLAARAEVDEADLGGFQGQREAMLIPLPRDRFGIVVDPTPRGGWPPISVAACADLRRRRMKFRVAHELGHTFFYWRGEGRPRRHVLGSAEQERFCDEYARALLVPTTAAEKVACSAAGVVELQERFDVSLEVAARALAGAHATDVGLWFGDSKRSLSPQWTTSAFVGQAPPLRRAGGLWLSDRRQFLYVA